MKLSYTDIKSGVIRVNPDDQDTIRRINHYNSQMPANRIIVKEIGEVRKGMVIFNLIAILGITLAKSWAIWSIALVLVVNILLYILHEKKYRLVKDLPGYPKFMELTTVKDEDIEFQSEKIKRDDLDEFLDEMKKEEIRDSIKVWNGDE